MKDARWINCVFIFPSNNSDQLTISKNSGRASGQMQIKSAILRDLAQKNS
jgi:hypothetical protein